MSKLSDVKSVNCPELGRLPLTDKGSSFTHGGKKRDHKPGRNAQDGGFIESDVPARLELSINLLKGFSHEQINQLENTTLTVKLANGETHMMPGAFVQEPISASDGEGKVVFISNTSERIS